MLIWIIGDSYGRGEFRLQRQQMLLVPSTGLDYYLDCLGYSVVNLSEPSASNFGQLRHCRWSLETADQRPDWIVWFHTEPVRDIVETVIDDPAEARIQYPDWDQYSDFDQVCAYINHRNYEYIHKEIDHRWHCAWIVIGGVGPLEPTIKNYGFCRFQIPSWVQQITGCEPLPRNSLAWHRWPEAVNLKAWKRSTLLDHFDRAEQYRQILHDSTEFPDNAHVSRTQYRALAQQVDQWIKQPREND